ncbi:phosphocholine cytidylyltransferase family protein [Trichlorobacter lovleyi]|uniref:Transferase, putative n=1 Tax=Trichlorobacter lovleyi (strain ATCC BAA-1151 / DSM 17278 / SZ) TaxID=398767 RepID=B3EBQ9_TRIL1|nr:phosphocholine cytidylyltransferase family protein [Trichlorobacter lovleyi]ACD97098.1 transferase, putative [Trichlorobacter lovleyi SZ]
MKAVILAAGRGSRMGSDTEGRPKCCTMLAGKNLLQWQLASLRAAGVTEILVVRGYRGELLYGDFSTVDNTRWAETNMASSLVCATDWLASGPTIISYSDIVYHPDHVRALIACDGSIAITADRLWLELWRLRGEDPIADAETFQEECGILKEIGGKPKTLEEVEAQYMGLLLFKPQGWKQFFDIYLKLSAKEQACLDMTSWIRHALQQDVTVQVCSVNGRWCEVDVQTDREIYEEMVCSVDSCKTVWHHDWRW